MSTPTNPPFLWGAATASYQVEGNIDTCDWANAARQGYVPFAGTACDHVNRFAADFDLARSLSHNAHRFSIEWARIEPREGVFDTAAMEHYRAVLSALSTRNMRPFVTLWHFTLPQWFAESGGWSRPDAVELFARYARHVVFHLHDLCDHFDTMNEPTVYASNGYLRGTWPPFYKLSFIDRLTRVAQNPHAVAAQTTSPLNLVRYFRTLLTLTHAHRTAYEVCKPLAPHLEIGMVKNVIVFRSSDKLLDRIRARLMHYQWTGWFMNRVHPWCDSIGLNYYFYKDFGNAHTYKKTDTGWDQRPEGVYEALKDLAHYGKPLYVTEAGCADRTDEFRTEYIRATVAGVLRARREGIDVRGMFYWSLLDNYEWALGYDMRFGLIEIDFATQTRRIRPSALAYRTLIEQHRSG